jgi:hypothetical protein
MPPIIMQDPTTIANTSKEKRRYERSGEGGKIVPKIGPKRTTYRIIIPIPKIQACPKGQITL